MLVFTKVNHNNLFAEYYIPAGGFTDSILQFNAGKLLPITGNYNNSSRGMIIPKVSGNVCVEIYRFSGQNRIT
ncbi:MAG: hypothetical protein HC867_10250 [Bacteroidia bacterium]|nr:hypothetical protein [Bacteroidia bacterium]